MQAAAYLHSDTYFHAIDSVEDIARTFDPAAPDVLRTQIIEALGDLGIWPMECARLHDGNQSRALRK